jgi:hypothetical protein
VEYLKVDYRYIHQLLCCRVKTKCINASESEEHTHEHGTLELCKVELKNEMKRKHILVSVPENSVPQ